MVPSVSNDVAIAILEDWGWAFEPAPPRKPPTLTPRERRILMAAGAGVPPVILARRFRSTPAAISTTLSKLRRLGHDIPRFPTTVRAPTSSVEIDQAVLKLLAAAAKRAGLTTREAAARVIRWAFKEEKTASIVAG